MIQAIANLTFTRKLLPEMKLRLRDFRWSKIWELVSPGSLEFGDASGQLLLDGLNTSIANIMVSSTGQ